MFRNFIPSEPKRKRTELEEKSQDSLPSSRSSSQPGEHDANTDHDPPKFKVGDIVEFNNGNFESRVKIIDAPKWKVYAGLPPAWYYLVANVDDDKKDFGSELFMRPISVSKTSSSSAAAPSSAAAVKKEEKTVKERLKSLKIYRKKEHKILSGLFDDVNKLYEDLCGRLKSLLDTIDSKEEKYGSRDKALQWMQKMAATRLKNGKVSCFERNFLDIYEHLDQLIGPDGITYREAYRGPVKRSWHVDGLELSSVDDLNNWNNHPIYIMWERRAPRQLSGAAGGAKKKSNFNDYDEDDKPHLTWELPTAARDIMSTRTGRKKLFPQGRLVIVIEKFKSENPANRREMITQHRVKGIYVVLRRPKRDDVKLCLVESRHFIEKFCVGERVDSVWFFDQQVYDEDSDE